MCEENHNAFDFHFVCTEKKKHDLTLENEFNFHRNGEHVCVCDNGNHNGGTLKVENMC